MRSPLALFLSRQFLVFLVVGGISAVANFLTGAGIRLISSSALVYGVSIVVGMVVGAVASFFLNRRFTFRVSTEPAGPQAARFALVTVGSVMLASGFGEGVLALWVGAGSPWLARANVESLAHIAAIGLNTLYGFLAMKFFALRERVARPS